MSTGFWLLILSFPLTSKATLKFGQLSRPFGCFDWPCGALSGELALPEQRLAEPSEPAPRELS